MAKSTKTKKRKSSRYSISALARRIGFGFIYVGLVGALTGAVGVIANAIKGLVTFTVGGVDVDLSIVIVIATIIFDILLLVKAARYFGVKL